MGGFVTLHFNGSFVKKKMLGLPQAKANAVKTENPSSKLTVCNGK